MLYVACSIRIGFILILTYNPEPRTYNSFIELIDIRPLNFYQNRHNLNHSQR